MTTTLITAFAIVAEPSAQRIDQYLDLLWKHAPDQDLLVGVSGPPEVIGLITSERVRRFPSGTTRAQMLNMLIGEADEGELLLLDGAIVPRNRSGRARENSPQGTPDVSEFGPWETLTAREVLLPPDAGLEDLPETDLSALIFTQSRHEDAPAGVILTRERALHIRGFDERPVMGDVLFADFCQRIRRLGDPPTRNHPGDRSMMIDLGALWTDLSSAAIGVPLAVRRSQIERVAADHSIYRNLVQWSVPVRQRPVLVTVSIATRNRGAYLLDSIRSVQAQDFQEFQLIVVDDGSDDDTGSVVAAVDDDRITYIRTDPRGISHARNAAADASVGYFTAVHDDDDMMLPHRITECLKVLDGEHRAAYGSWVNFDDQTAEMALHITKKSFGRDLVSYSNQTPGHSTWLLPTRYIRVLRYDESYSSSVDHNLAVRTLMMGLTWKHTGKVLFLRRMHATQVSVTDSRRQIGAAQLTNLASDFAASHNGRRQSAKTGKELGFPDPADRSKLFETFGAYLPDHLVRRSTTIHGLVGKKVLAVEGHDQLGLVLSDVDLLTGRTTAELGRMVDITWDDMVRIRRSGLLGFVYTAVSATAPQPESIQPPSSDLLDDRIRRLVQEAVRAEPSAVLLVIDGEPSSPQLIEASPDPIVLCHHLSVTLESNQRISRVVYGLQSTDAARRFLLRSSAGSLGDWRIIQPAGQPMENIMPPEGSTR